MGFGLEPAALLFPADNQVTYNQAEVALSTANSSFPAFDRLLRNEAGGNIQITGGRQFDTISNLSNAGQVFVGVSSSVNVNGTYTQTAGLTRVDGAMTITGGNPIIQGGKLTGGGTINGGPIKFSATLGPGSSVGTLSVEALHYMSGSVFEMEIDGATADSVHVFGGADAFQLELGGSYDLNVSYIGANPTLTEYPLFTWSADDPLLTDAGLTWNISGLRAEDVQVEYRPDSNAFVLVGVVPEPAGLTLLLLRRRLLRRT